MSAQLEEIRDELDEIKKLISYQHRLILRPAEVADCLGLGQSKARQLLRSGEIASFRVGRCVMVPREEVEKWVEKKHKEAKQ